MFKNAAKCWAVFLGVAVLGCQTSKEGKPSHNTSRVSFDLQKEVHINLPFPYKVGRNFTIQFYERNDTTFAMLGDFDNSRLIEVDISNERYSHTIPLPRVARKTYPVFMHHYINADTIVILPDISNAYRLFHNNFLYSIDYEGRENVFYQLMDSPFRMSDEEVDSAQATFFHNFQPLQFANHRLFVHPLAFNSGMTISDLNKYEIPELGYFTFRGDSVLMFNSVPYHRSVGYDALRYAKEQKETYFSVVDEDHLVVSHANDHNLHLVNIHTGDIITSSETGRILPPPEALKNAEAYSDITPYENANSTLFKEVLYDPSRKLILRFGCLSTDLDLNRGDLNDFRFSNVWVGLYNETLDLVGQGMVPEWLNLHPRPVFFDNDLISIAQGEDEFEIVFQYVDVDTTQVGLSDFLRFRDSVQDIKPFVSKEDLNSLYDELHIPAKSLILTVPSHSCPYCLNYSIDYYLRNLRRMEEERVYLIVSEESATNILKSTTSPFIIIKEGRVLENLLDQNVNNPALMLWDGSKVTKTMILPPDEVERLDYYLEIFNG